jgi:hypothetical protein
MTLVFSVHGRDTVWLVADRRLSYGGLRAPIDDAVKVMCLETSDGVGVLGYAGLGATSKGTQPSDWMSAVLRGRGGMGFEQSLGLLATVATRELPRHLVSVAGGAHFIIVPAFLRGTGPRVYSIDNVVSNPGKQHSYRFTKYEITGIPGSPPPRIAVGGSGAACVRRKPKAWYRELLNLVRANDSGKASDYLIADRLAAFSYEVHEELTKRGDHTVGPRSIVVWRRRPGAGAVRGGGGHQFYTGTGRDPGSPAVPWISHGGDVQALGTIYMEEFQRKIAKCGFNFTSPPPDLDTDEITRRLTALPSGPDEKLR